MPSTSSWRVMYAIVAAAAVCASQRREPHGGARRLACGGMDHGGHFPALEQPQLWMDDLRAFVRAATR